MTWVLVILIGVLVVLGGYSFLQWLSRGIDRTPDELADALEGLLTGSYRDEFDALLEIRIADPELERIRKRCDEIVGSDDPRWRRKEAELDAEFPDRESAPPLFWVTDEGIEVMRSCIEQLREMAAQKEGER